MPGVSLEALRALWCDHLCSGQVHLKGGQFIRKLYLKSSFLGSIFKVQKVL